ncbi:type II toxin-antitoxin system VapC family toxin [Leucobacter insecticola]|uniref:Type II toxin-antitoxin system VapC family toxin n=1 Tax=Leucobacter insecticola TaxID=2714934 RepID=A0A6G8FH25_9MICO|nr:type II toxin-antitoxin system VapC family toxin [Leucobacter insecticola]QIM15654.1 type II toxin-antitoxin system VapC family toxin [Leucobacter insecticola]
MRLLLDTHVLLWWLADSPRLLPKHREIISDGANDVLVSSVSVAEISIQASLGKLDAPSNTVEAIEQSGFRLLPLEASHAEELRSLPWHHRDPFDRMLIAQARVEQLTLITRDHEFAQYDVKQA